MPSLLFKNVPKMIHPRSIRTLKPVPADWVVAAIREGRELRTKVPECNVSLDAMLALKAFRN